MPGSDSSDLADATRRAVLKGAAGALGVGVLGSASAHEWGDDEASGPAGNNSWVSQETDTRGDVEGAQVVGYHALGDTGPAEADPKAEARDPHYGGITEIKIHGDYAYVGVFSSGSDTPGRGMAILDISDYNEIPADASPPEQEAMLENANLSVVSFLRNNTAGAAVMDVKVSDDGEYVFLSTQPYQALFGTAQGNTQDPTVVEGLDPTPNTEDEGATVQTSGIVAVDVSDKRNPETLGNFSLGGSGSHNSYHHRIDGEDYVFAINDSGNLGGAGEGMYVLRFDRATGQLELVNQWEYEGNLAQGDVGPDDVTGGAYIHDMEVQDDPRTGKPTLYLAYWDRGLWALDVSDPENMEAIGHFDMWAAHFTTPAPDLVDGKRVVVASQEVAASDLHTGRVYLVDADGIHDEDPNADSVPRDDAGVVRMGELAVWEWQNEHSYPDEENAVEFGPYDFSLSPHNSTIVEHPRTDGNGNLRKDENGTVQTEFWIHQAHYGGGVRFLRVDAGTQDGLVGREARFEVKEDAPNTIEEDESTYESDGAGGPHHTTDWTLVEEGYARPTYGTPKDSRLEGLNYITPFVWGAAESNGITFASDINQGVHAVKADGIPIGGAPLDATVERSDSGDVFRSGRVDRVTVDVVAADDGAQLRDRVPDGWTVADAGDGTTVTEGGTTYVEFGEVAAGDSLSYFAEADTGPGSYRFGPVEASDDGERWTTLGGTGASAYVVGGATELTLGTAAGAIGALTSQRERLRDRLGGLLGDD